MIFMKRLFLFTMFLLSAAGIALSAEGDLDVTFGKTGIVTFNSGNNDAVSAVAVQSDGKLVIAGTASNGLNSDVLILRLNSDGTPDAAFGEAGTVTFNSSANASDAGKALAVQLDGKIIVAGAASNGVDNDALILRLNSDGTLDTTFGVGGVTTFNGGGSDAANGLAIRSDGKIVISGQSFNGANNDCLVIRLNSDGSPDTTFGTAGVFLYNGGGSDICNAVAVSSDGRTAAVGRTSVGTNNDVLVIRLHSNGSRDLSFSADGVATFNSGANGGDAGNAAAIQPDGKILVAGQTFNGSNSDALVLRYSTVGTLDPAFGTDGVVTFNSGANGDDAFRAMRLQTNGAVVVAGQGANIRNHDILIARMNRDGTFDTTFSTDGITRYNGVADGEDSGNAVALQPDGKIVVAGTSFNGRNNDALVLRFAADGGLDLSFSEDGAVRFKGKANPEDAANAVALQPDGKIIVAGTIFNGANNDVLVLRLSPRGKFDATFNGDGVVTFNSGLDGSDIARAAAVQADGRIVVAGASFNGTNNDVLVLRLNAGGNPDTTFSGNGIVRFNGAADGDDIGHAVALQPDGKIVVAGTSFNGLHTDVIVVRFMSDGTPDGTFGVGGAAVYDSGRDDAGRAVAVQPDGRIVVAGTSFNGLNNDALVLRFTAAGLLDTTFSSDGVVTYNSPAQGNDAANAVTLQADGKIVVAGIHNGTDALVLRRHGDGSPDTAFSADGRFRFSGLAGGAAAARAVAVQADGKIVVAGISNNNVLVLRLVGQRLRVASPNGGEVFPSGSITPISVEWSAPPAAVSFTIERSFDGGATWDTVATGASGTTFPWPSPTPVNNQRQCLVRVIGFNADGARVNADRSDGFFTIEVVKLAQPDGGGPYISGDPLDIIWTTNETKRPVQSVKLFYTVNGGRTWNEILPGPAGNPGIFNWTVPTVAVPKRQSKVRVVLKDINGKTVGSDVSNVSFTIQPGP
jgi:uncharacterized delta-60 repeat protein